MFDPIQPCIISTKYARKITVQKSYCVEKQSLIRSVFETLSGTYYEALFEKTAKADTCLKRTHVSERIAEINPFYVAKSSQTTITWIGIKTTQKQINKKPTNKTENDLAK